MAVDFVAFRQPGPLAPEQVQQCLHDIARHLTSSNVFYTIDVILRSIRPVLTASASELCQLSESPDPAISANAVAEALLRGEKRCLPNLARSALRLPAKTDRPDVAALYVHARCRFAWWTECSQHLEETAFGTESRRSDDRRV